jgi:hypothetical protein
MKLKLFLTLSICLIFSGCATYEHPDTEPFANLNISSPDMSVKKGMTDDMTIVRMNDISDGRKKLLGILRVPAKDKFMSYKIPVSEMELHVIVNFAFVGAAASCEAFLDMNSREGKSYDLDINFNLEESATCTAKLFDMDKKLIGEQIAPLKGVSF